MRNNTLFLSRLTVTVLVAGILSAVIFSILSFVLGIFGLYQEYFDHITVVSNLIFGLAVGYRLNDLLRERRKRT